MERDPGRTDSSAAAKLMSTHLVLLTRSWRRCRRGQRIGFVRVNVKKILSFGEAMWSMDDKMSAIGGGLDAM